MDSTSSEVVEKKPCLRDAIQKARQKLEEGRKGLAWPPETLPPDLSSLDRNLDALATELAQRCSQIFQTASSAVTRAAELSALSEPTEEITEAHKPAWFRERTRTHGQASDALLQLWTAYVPSTEQSGTGYLCFARTVYSPRSSRSVNFAVMACEIEDTDDGGTAPVELLDAEYFDDAHLATVYRGRDGDTTLALVEFAAVPFLELPESHAQAFATREALVHHVLERVQSGEVPTVPLKVAQARTLAGCTEGAVALSVNGRKGRRVACVLGEDGTALEVFDMEGEEDDEDEDEERAEDGAEGDEAE